MKQLLIVWHSRTDAARQMAHAASHGARRIAAELNADTLLQVSLKHATEATIDDLLGSQAFLFCCPENLASMSGEMKAFFDRCYYAGLDHLGGRHYACAISAGSDGSNAARQIARICQGWRLRAAAPALIVNLSAQSPTQIAAPKTVTAADLARCEELGGLLAALAVMPA